MATCVIDRDSIKRGIIDSITYMSVEGGFFISPSTGILQVNPEISEDVTGVVNGINEAFQSNVVVGTNDPQTYRIEVPVELIEAYETALSPEIEAQQEVLFEQKNYGDIPAPAATTLNRVNSFLERAEVNTQKVNNIVVDGNMLGANGVAFPLLNLVQYTSDDSTVLTEEALHIGVELLSQKNPSLYQEMEGKITSYPIYKETLATYRNNPAYQKGGKVDIPKIKKEAIGKLLTQVVVNQQVDPPTISWWGKVKNFLKSLFSPMRGEMDAMNQAVETILGEDIGTVRNTLLSSKEYLIQSGFTEEMADRVINLAKSPISDTELYVAVGEMAPAMAFLSVSPTVEHKAKSILDTSKQIIETPTGYSVKGKEVKRTATSVALSKLSERMTKTNPLYAGIRDRVSSDGGLLTPQVRQAYSEFLTPEGTLDPDIDLDSVIKGKSREFQVIATGVHEKLSSFPEGTKFMLDVNVGNSEIAANIDVLAIDPTETYHILNYHTISQPDGQRIERAEADALISKVQTIRDILSRSYRVSKFGQTRTILINKRKDATGELTEMANIDAAAYHFLAPLPTLSETLGSDALDTIYAEFSAISNKNKERKDRSVEGLTRGRTLSGVLGAFRAIQISKTLSPISTQIGRLSEQIDILNNKYKELKDTATPAEMKDLLSDMAMYLQVATSLKNIPDGVSEFVKRGIKVEPYSIQSLASNSAELNISASQLFANASALIEEYVTKPNGIIGLTSPEIVQHYLRRNFGTTSMSQQATIRALHLITSDAQHTAELNHSKLLKRIEPLRKSYNEWAKKKGVSPKNALSLITQKDEEGNYVHRLVDRVDRSFFEQAQQALSNRDLSWVKANIDMKAYQNWFSEERKNMFSYIEATTPEDGYGTKDYDEVVAEAKQNWVDRYDLNLGLNSTNTQIYRYPLLSKHTSKEYRDLEKPENKPALELYKLITELNERAVENGVIDNFVGQTFIPFAHKDSLDALLDGSAGKVLKGRIKEALSEREAIEQYGEYRPDLYSKNSIPFSLIANIAKREYDPATGEITADYSNVSQDIFSLLHMYGLEIERYEAYSKAEQSAGILRAIEADKKSFETGRFSGKRKEGGGLVENVSNLDTLDKHIRASIYGQGQDPYDLTGTFTIKTGPTIDFINKKLGLDIKYDTGEIKLPVTKVMSSLRSWFIYKALGMNPSTAIVNLFGTTFQSLINSGKYFNRGDMRRAGWRLYSAKTQRKFGSKEYAKILGVVDYFIPLVDGENLKDRAGRLHQTALSKLDLSETLMSMLRHSDRPAQWMIASAYLENTIVEDGEAVNIREYLLRQPDYVSMYEGTTEEIADKRKRFEEEVKTLQKRNLESIATFNSQGELEIPGLEYNSESVRKVREKIQQLSKNATGMGTNNEFRVFNTSLIGRNLMTFLSWAPRLIDNRLGGLRDSTVQGDKDWGRILTFTNFIRKGITESGTSLIDLYSLSEKGVASLKDEFQKQVDKYEAETGKDYYERGENEAENRAKAERDFIELYQRNVKSQTKELLLLLALGGMLFSLLALGPDDDERQGLYKYATKVTRKIFQEIAFFYNPLSVFDLTDGKVFPAISVITDAIKFQNDLTRQMYGWVIEDEELQDKAKPVGRLFKTLPGLNQLLPIIAIMSEDSAEELGYQLPEASFFEPEY